jgi:hypothetical protein
MNQKYVVNLTKDERWIIFTTLNAKNAPKTLRTRCNILLLADNSVGKALTQNAITVRCEVSEVCVYKTIKNYCQNGLEYALRRRERKILQNSIGNISENSRFMFKPINAK